MADKGKVGGSGTPFLRILQAGPWNGYSHSTDMGAIPTPDGDEKIFAYLLEKTVYPETAFRNLYVEFFHQILTNLMNTIAMNLVLWTCFNDDFPIGQISRYRY